MTTLALEPSLDSKTVSSSGESSFEDVSDMRYWKPWQPPDCTVTRNARSVLASFLIISFSRYKQSAELLENTEPAQFTFAALAEMSISISSPFSSLRGFAVTWTAGREGVVEKWLKLCNGGSLTCLYLELDTGGNGRVSLCRHRGLLNLGSCGGSFREERRRDNRGPRAREGDNEIARSPSVRFMMVLGFVIKCKDARKVAQKIDKKHIPYFDVIMAARRRILAPLKGLAAVAAWDPLSRI